METEDEFMVSLVKLYKAANPTVSAEVFDTAVKRKFLQGISPVLKKNLFVFCNKPYDPATTRDKLLQHCREAKVHLAPTPEPDSTSTDKVLCIDNNQNKNDQILAAINELKLDFNSRLDNTNKINILRIAKRVLVEHPQFAGENN